MLPDGASLLVARQVLNLTHRDSHEHPAALVPGERVTVPVELDAIGHRVKAGSRLRVGLAWSGAPAMKADRRRSVRPDLLTGLLGVPDVAFVSLQKAGPPLPDGFPVIDFMDGVRDFADTAALVANLDLVVSVDTAVAHLAAAMGKRVWLLSRFDPCWRWLLGEGLHSAAHAAGSAAVRWLRRRRRVRRRRCRRRRQGTACRRSSQRCR